MKEQSFQHIVMIYLAAINVVTFIMYGIDKLKAKRSKWRIREAALLGMAVLGGSVGAWLGMKVWHHKTQHKKFKYGIPIILITQILILLLTSCKTQRTIAPPASGLLDHQHVPEHSPKVFLVMYDEGIGKDPLLKAIKEYKCEIVYDYGIINSMALKKPKDKTLEETMRYFKTVKSVTNVEYDHIIRLTDPINPKLEIK